MYICNCNGLRARDIEAAIDSGAATPRQIFRHCGSAAQCARCVPEMAMCLRARASSAKPSQDFIGADALSG